MFYVVSKLTSSLIDPLFWVVGLLVASILLKKSLWKKYCFWGAILLFFVLGNGALISWAERAWMRDHIPQLNPEKIYDYALIQGGFGTYNPLTGRTQVNQAAERLVEPLRLYKSGKVKKLFITGDNSFSSRDYPEARGQFLKYMADFGVPDSDLVLDGAAKNTRQSALRTPDMLGTDFKAENCLLVTCAIHIPRALKCYQKAGMNPVPYATSVPDPYKIELTTFGIGSGNFDRWNILIHEMLGMIAYKIMGYI